MSERRAGTYYGGDPFYLSYCPKPVPVRKVSLELNNGCANYWNIRCFQKTDQNHFFAVIKAEMMEELDKLRAKIQTERNND